MPEPACSTPPDLIPLTTCLEVTVGVPQKFNISALNQCDPSIVDMSDILISKDVVGLNKSAMVISSTNTYLAYITIIWTPTSDQIGLQEICAIAYTE